MERKGGKRSRAWDIGQEVEGMRQIESGEQRAWRGGGGAQKKKGSGEAMSLGDAARGVGCKGKQLR